MYLITNRHLCSEDRYLEVLKEASYSGAEYIVLREKDLNNEDLKKLYLNVKDIVNKNTKIIINNNIEVYESVNADGIHLSYEHFINYNKNNYFAGVSGKLIGVSTHSIEEVSVLSKMDIDYIFLSHIYETKCKEGLVPKGTILLEKAQRILSNSKIKLVALGGINHNNFNYTLNYCDDIAVMSSIMSSNNVVEEVLKYNIKDK